MPNLMFVRPVVSGELKGMCKHTHVRTYTRTDRISLDSVYTDLTTLNLKLSAKLLVQVRNKNNKPSAQRVIVNVFKIKGLKFKTSSKHHQNSDSKTCG